MRRFSGRVVVAALAVVGGYAAARSLQLKLPATPATPQAARSTAPAPEVLLADVPSDGDALIRSVLKALEHWPNIAAQFRQSLHIGDVLLTGTGGYWQRGIGNQRCTCWQWQTLVDGQKAMFTQIYNLNGELWTDARYPDSRTVTCLDVETLRRDLSAAIDAQGQGRAGPKVDELELLARGGVSQLVAQLRRSFTFGTPTVIVENGETLLAVVGRWRDDALKRDWPALDAASMAAWPEQLPHHVLVKVGRQDLFPRSIEYRRAADAALADAADAADDPLARYEFFDVSWTTTVPERLFEFSNVDLDWRDVTEQVFEQLRPQKPPEPTGIVASSGDVARQ